MHHKKVKIISIFNKVNSGKTMLTDILYNSHNKELIKQGDTFRYGENIYEIKSVEPIDVKGGAMIGLLVKKITPKEFLSKIAVKDTSTMKAVRRRIKYRFFIRIWQNIVLKFLVIRDKIFSN